MKKVKLTLLLLASASLLFAFGPMQTARASNLSSPFFGELVWGNNQLWQLLVPPAQFIIPSNALAQENFYEAAPQIPTMGFPVSPQSDACEHLGIASPTTGCFHDHIIPIPTANQGSFNVNWHVIVIVCFGNQASVTTTSGSCTSQTVTGIGFDGKSVTLNLAKVVTGGPLTSVSAVETAENAGLVSEHDTGVTFICPIQHT